MKICDVIIPIYNAYDYVKECITSVIKNTDLKTHGLILINDRSSDERIRPLLEETLKRNKELNITVLENRKNLGFVKTVNKGMKYSKQDVLLLNSDTEVTGGWLEKIMECAYSQPKVATVTPLSNNATLVSVPKGLQQNNIPHNMKLEEYGELIEKIAYNEGIELPTAHGFCMYIKREALNNIGYFDDITFGRGYGEENDFSFRALDYGYKNLLCDNTIVYHKGEQSFSGERAILAKENSKKISERYPIYSKRVDFFCENFPLLHICNNVNYALKIREKENILVLIHDWKDAEANLGGTTLHVYDLIMNLKYKYNFHVLTPENGIYKLYSYFDDTKEIISFPAIGSSNIMPRYNNEYKNMIEEIISAFNISLVHVHHMLGHFFDVADVIKSNKIKGIISMHDLYSVNMLYGTEMNKDDNILKMWQEDWNEMLKKFDHVIAPSKSAKKELENVFNGIEIKVIGHGSDISRIPNDNKLKDKIFNIAFIGVMVEHKGSDILEGLIRNYRGSKVKIHLFGNTEIPFLMKNHSNYIYHGKYNRKDLPKMLHENKINLVCNFSVVPETYSYTLTETIAAGIPVLAIDLGAVGERVKENKIGWTIPKTTKIKKIISKISDILEDKEKYYETIENVSRCKIKSINEMAKEYDELYSTIKTKLIDEKSINNLKKIIKQSQSKKIMVYDSELNWILNSTKWKIVSKIRVPSVIKKIVKRVIK